MPVVAAVGAVVSTAASVVGAVVTGVVSTVGTVVGAVGSAIGTAITAKGVAAAVAGAGTSALIQGAMEKKALKKTLSAQEEQALRNYEVQNKALAMQEQQAIDERIAKEQAAEAEAIAKAEAEAEAEQSKILSAKAQQIETLANLKAAQVAYRPPTPQPVIYTAPQPVSQRVGFFDYINTSIHKFFGSW